jgi:type IV pilus assembly protein PilC
MVEQAVAVARPRGKRGFGDTLRAFLTYSPTKVKPQIIVLFCRQLASFVRAGVPVTTAMETFAQEARTPALKESYTSVALDIQRGVRLSTALSAHPKVFPGILTDMVRSAEETGRLDEVLVQAGKHIAREASARQKIRAAMTYPVIIMSFALVITIGIVAFVLPKFRELYSSLGVKTPGILNAMLDLSAFIGGHALALAIGTLLVFIALGFGWRTERGRYAVDRMLLRIPLIAAMLRTSMTERFCRTLGDMLAAGVPISQTYGVVIQNVRNRVFRRALDGVGPAMASGQGMYRPLEQSGIFAPAVIQMFRVGEETGHLDDNLIEAAEMYEEELDYRIKRLTAFLEPAMIIFVGIIVGFVAVTLVTSIYSLAGGYH